MSSALAKTCKLIASMICFSLQAVASAMPCNMASTQPTPANEMAVLMANAELPPCHQTVMQTEQAEQTKQTNPDSNLMAKCLDNCQCCPAVCSFNAITSYQLNLDKVHYQAISSANFALVVQTPAPLFRPPIS